MTSELTPTYDNDTGQVVLEGLPAGPAGEAALVPVPGLQLAFDRADGRLFRVVVDTGPAGLPSGPRGRYRHHSRRPFRARALPPRFAPRLVSGRRSARSILMSASRPYVRAWPVSRPRAAQVRYLPCRCGRQRPLSSPNRQGCMTGHGRRRGWQSAASQASSTAGPSPQRSQRRLLPWPISPRRISRTAAKQLRDSAEELPAEPPGPRLAGQASAPGPPGTARWPGGARSHPVPRA